MLATLVGAPFHLDGWVYEEKYDGFRILAYKEGRTVTLLTRNLKDRTADFPEVEVAGEDLAEVARGAAGRAAAGEKKVP